ncbi:MAG: Glycerol-3-phosphate acyltransferase [Alphaproteobacteria bacterium MarineAlpha6_Bin4]|nr:MAG: Glycerol-3-phosphate acyltransferase [Alphaproteobacteria bacterium MarineAlpha6_Bin4]
MLLEIILAFLIGSIPTGYLLNKYFGHGDIRKVGSGNIGATNVLRHSGKLLGLLTLLIDIGKGFLALELLYGSGGRWTISILGASVVLGHIFSPWLKFKGGKGVATMLGVILFISSVGYWKLSENIFFITTFSWLMIVFFTRYVALGSVISLTIATIYSYFFIPSSFLFFVLMNLLIAYRHKDNFERIKNKTEHKITF